METHRLPELMLPELRAKWLRLTGAREIVQHAAQAMQAMEAEYQSTLSTLLRLQGLNPDLNWRVNLETGEISEVTEADVTRQNGFGQVALPSAGSAPQPG